MRAAFFLLLILSLCRVEPASAQAQEEDVVILKDGGIIRGTLTQTVTPGSSVTIKRTNGRVTSLLWQEVFLIKRFPVNMPDSTIAALYVRPAGENVSGRSVSTDAGGFSSPFGAASRDTTEEDVLVLAGGKIVRGQIVESSRQGSVSLWTADQKLSVYDDSGIQKRLHLQKGTTDSTIDVLYVNPPRELLAADYRILTVFGGLSVAGGQFANPQSPGGDPAGSGFAVGLHASVRVFPTIRWATSAIYGKNSTDLPSVFTDFSATGGPAPHELIWLLTGGEVRTEGTSAMKAFGFVQGGLLFSRISSFDVVIPQTARHPEGTGKQGGASSKSFAICAGAGMSLGRFSITGRWLTSTASYDYTATVDFGSFFGGPQVTAYKYDQPVSVVLLSVGFSPF